RPTPYTGEIDADACNNFIDNQREYFTVVDLSLSEWVQYTALNLVSDAKSWWRSSGLSITTPWAQFEEEFLAFHTPPDAVAAAREALESLKQGRRSVALYCTLTSSATCFALDQNIQLTIALTEDIDMHDAAPAVPSVFRPTTPPARNNPFVVRIESKVEKKQKDLEGWGYELESSQSDCEEISQRYQSIAKLVRDAVKAVSIADPTSSPEEKQAGVAELNSRKKAIVEELQAAKETVQLAQSGVAEATASLAELTEETRSDDVWQDDRSLTSSTGRSKAGLYLCAPNANNPWHADIVRCLKEKMVPLQSSTGKIDFAGLVPKVFTNAPSLSDIFKKKDGESRETALLIVQGI
ncbi:hypothetical protein BGZ72_002452, partial [Mortierella alpina]